MGPKRETSTVSRYKMEIVFSRYIETKALVYSGLVLWIALCISDVKYLELASTKVTHAPARDRASFQELTVKCESHSPQIYIVNASFPDLWQIICNPSISWTNTAETLTFLFSLGFLAIVERRFHDFMKFRENLHRRRSSRFLRPKENSNEINPHTNRSSHSLILKEDPRSLDLIDQIFEIINYNYHRDPNSVHFEHLKALLRNNDTRHSSSITDRVKRLTNEKGVGVVVDNETMTDSCRCNFEGIPKIESPFGFQALPWTTTNSSLDPTTDLKNYCDKRSNLETLEHHNTSKKMKDRANATAQQTVRNPRLISSSPAFQKFLLNLRDGIFVCSYD